MNNFDFALKNALSDIQDLSPSGIGVANPNGSWAKCGMAFQASIMVLEHLEEIKNPSPRSSSSYWFKHLAERLSQVCGTHVYVPNGVMIVAIHHRRIGYRKSGYNLVPAISATSLRRFENTLTRLEDNMKDVDYCIEAKRDRLVSLVKHKDPRWRDELDSILLDYKAMSETKDYFERRLLE